MGASANLVAHSKVQHSSARKASSTATAKHLPADETFSPPTEPRAHRKMTVFLARAAESQGDWKASSDATPAQTESGVGDRRDPIFSTSTLATSPTWMHPYEARLAREKAENQAACRTRLAILRTRASQLAEAYRNFGLVFHSIPAYVLFHPTIHPQIRTLARTSFLHGGGFYAMPDILHVLGTLEHVLRDVARRLRESWWTDLEARKVHAGLHFAERLVSEGVPKVAMLRQAVEILCRLRMILWTEGNLHRESKEQCRRRKRFHHAWAYALPTICWSGFANEADLGATEVSAVAL